MKITINKQEVETGDVTTLQQLLERLELATPGKAVAIGTRIVPRRMWSDTALAEGMNITVISAVCGG